MVGKYKLRRSGSPHLIPRRSARRGLYQRQQRTRLPAKPRREDVLKMFSLAATVVETDGPVWAAAWGQSAVRPELEYLVTGNISGELRRRTWDGQVSPETLLRAGRMSIICCDVMNNGRTLVSSSIDGQIHVTDLDTLESVSDYPCDVSEVWNVSCSPDGSTIVTGGHNGQLTFIQVASKEKTVIKESGTKFILSVAFSPDGSLVACGSTDGIVDVFDVRTLKKISTFEGHAMPVRALAFFQDSDTLLTASDDSHMKMYRLKSGELDGSISGHASCVLSIDIANNSKTFASCSADSTVKLWDSRNLKECQQTLQAHSDQVWCVRFNRKGNSLVSVGYGGHSYIHTTTHEDFNETQALLYGAGGQSPV